MTPWDQTTQLVTASLMLITESESGPKLEDVSAFLKGNVTADASSGLASFTDLDVSKAAVGYKLQFTLPQRWSIGIIFTGSFSVRGGPATLLNLAVEPATKSTTTQVLSPQPTVELTDMYGNFNPDAVPAFVTVIIRPDDPSAFPGWTDPSVPDRVSGGRVESKQGRAEFTELALYGLGIWHIEFSAVLNFQTVSTSAASTIFLQQLDSPAVEFVLAVDINDWSNANEVVLLETLATICGLDIAALEVTDIAAGSVVAQVAIHVPDASSYFQMIADDLNSESSALAGLGVYVARGPGIEVQNEAPAPPPAAVAPAPYTGLPLDMVNVWAGSVQSLVIAGYSLGIGMAIFSEIAVAFARAERMSELSSPEGEPMLGNRWHTGDSLQCGGAFRSFITHVQFIAAMSSLGGRGGQPQFYFQFPEPINRGTGNFTSHNQTLITDVRLPHGMRVLAETLDWTNLRSNVTYLLGNADLFPRPCDVYAQQVTIGTCFVVIFIQISVYCVRTAMHKTIERVTLLSYGKASESAAMNFPKWESLVITNTYYGITQVIGVCIGSFCTDWMTGGFFLGLFPLASCLLMTYLTYQAVSRHKVVKFVRDDSPGIASSVQRVKRPRMCGKWKRQFNLADSRCTTSMRYLTLYATIFNDLRDGFSTYYGSLSMLMRMICGIASGASHNWMVSSLIFLSFYSIDLLVVAISQPYVDVVRNRMEVLLAMSRVGIIGVGFGFLHGDLLVDDAEEVLFWLAIAGILLAFTYQAVEITALFWGIARQKENPRDDSVVIAKRTSSRHLAGRASVFDSDDVKVPHSLIAYKDVSVLDEEGKPHQVLDQRHLVLSVNIKGASGLKSVDCRKNRSMCTVKLGRANIEAHHRNFARTPVIYHDGEIVYKTLSRGVTMTANSAWWNEEFKVQLDDETNGIVTFVLWENVSKSWKNLGTAVVHLEPLLASLNASSQPLEKKYRVMPPGMWICCPVSKFL